MLFFAVFLSWPCFPYSATLLLSSNRPLVTFYLQQTAYEKRGHASAFANYEASGHKTKWAISELLFAFVSKRVHSYENVFRLQVHFPVNQTHFAMKVFA